MNFSNELPQETFFDLEHLRYADSVALGRAVRALGSNCSSQQQAAQRLVSYLYEVFRCPATKESRTALVRCFQTHPFADLPEATKRAVEAPVATDIPEGLRCLTLLGTRGDDADWNQPETSMGHRAILMPNVSMIERAPMIAGLLAQMGVEAEEVVAPAITASTLLLDTARQSFNVFHVEDAVGSAYIPAQQTFVERQGIRSVVGIGGLLPSGELFAVILFAKVPIPRETAALFRTLALSVKLLFLPFGPTKVFSGPRA